MDSSTTRFRFRDSIDVNTTSETDESSSLSSTGNDESKIESLTAKGITRLCSELLELKKASDEDFYKSVYCNYSAFIRIFEQVGGIENELTLLRQHFATQRVLVKDLTDNIYLEILSKESIDSIIEESLDGHQSPLDNLEAHTDAVSEKLDILQSEHRLDEALVILEMEDLTLKMIHLEENPMPPFLVHYDSEISERRSKLAYQFAQLADHPRVSAPELQKALSGLCRLGECQRANQLLLKFYRSRIENGVHDLRSARPYLHKTYIKEVAKLVFSMISQAARSFVLLHGEKSPYASELIQWAREETEVFASYFDKYVKSTSEVNGGLSIAVEAVKCVISFCSILETQNLVLVPCLVKLIRPYMEEVLKMHIEHYKKVICVFTTTDDWVLGKHLISGILKDDARSMLIGQNMEYVILSSSGRKFVTFLQETIKEVSPLVLLQMESFILNELLALIKEYVATLERAMLTTESTSDRSGPRILSERRLSQQLSILANAFSLMLIVPTTARCIFKGSEWELNTDTGVESLPKDLANWILSVQAVGNQLRALFYQNFIHRVMSIEEGSVYSAETYYAEPEDPDALNDLMPSVAIQALFLELRQLEKVGGDIFLLLDWSAEEFLREIMMLFFTWLENNQDFWKYIEENANFQRMHGFEQFVLDMQFLVEVASFGGYCSSDMVDASLSLISRMESAFLSIGVDPYRDLLAGEWATNAATEAMHKLLETERLDTPPNNEHTSTSEEDCNSHESNTTEDAKTVVEESPELEPESTEIVELQKLKDTSTEEPKYNSFEEDVSDDSATSDINWQLQSGEGSDITQSDNDEFAGLLNESELRKELVVTGSPVGSSVEDNSDANENKMVIPEIKSGDDSISSSDEQIENEDA